MGGNVSTASSTPAGGWYADPLDASLLRWWDGATWTKQTMPADSALGASGADAKPTLSAVPPLLAAVPRADLPLTDEAYVPPNSVFRMSETAGAEAYVPEWSGLADISPEVALSGVPVQLALTSTPSEPPIPVSADVFPSLRGEEPAAKPKEPVWKVEAPLAAPVDQLFPVASAPPALPAAVFPEVPAAFAAPAAPVAPVAPVAPAMPVAPVAPVVALGAPISPPAQGATLSPAIFPVAAEVAPAAPVAPVAEPVPVPQPSGDSFPGIVPSAAPAASMTAAAMPPQEMPAQAMPAPLAPAVAPTMFAEPPAPAAFAPAVPQPVAPQPVAPQPAAAQAAVAAPTVYMGPPPVEVATDPVAPPDFQPFAASTPGATYVPLAPRPIPQPLQLGAPAAPATPSELVPTMLGAAPVAPAPPAAPAEYWPTQGAPTPGVQYQPDPGAYVPFDPNAVHLEPVPIIPFSSRDPFNSASTARPGMRAYAAAPVGPTGSTWTGGLVFMLLAPLISTATFFVWSQLTPFTRLSADSVTWLPFALFGISLLGLASAQIDRSALARRGYFDLASPFWVLLIPPLVYLIVRALRLRGQGKGAGAAIGLWVLSYVGAYALTILVAFGWLSAPTPERVASLESAMQQQLATQNITATVSCPAVTSFAPGSTFECTVTPQQGSPLLFRVTVQDWSGFVTLAPVSSSTS